MNLTCFAFCIYFWKKSILRINTLRGRIGNSICFDSWGFFFIQRWILMDVYWIVELHRTFYVHVPLIARRPERKLRPLPTSFCLKEQRPIVSFQFLEHFTTKSSAIGEHMWAIGSNVSFTHCYTSYLIIIHSLIQSDLPVYVSTNGVFSRTFQTWNVFKTDIFHTFRSSFKWSFWSWL